jgi:hypothetical protein
MTVKNFDRNKKMTDNIKGERNAPEVRISFKDSPSKLLGGGNLLTIPQKDSSEDEDEDIASQASHVDR